MMIGGNDKQSHFHGDDVSDEEELSIGEDGSTAHHVTSKYQSNAGDRCNSISDDENGDDDDVDDDEEVEDEEGEDEEEDEDEDEGDENSEENAAFSIDDDDDDGDGDGDGDGDDDREGGKANKDRTLKPRKVKRVNRERIPRVEDKDMITSNHVMHNHSYAGSNTSTPIMTETV